MNNTFVNYYINNDKQNNRNCPLIKIENKDMEHKNESDNTITQKISYTNLIDKDGTMDIKPSTNNQNKICSKLGECVRNQEEDNNMVENNKTRKCISETPLIFQENFPKIIDCKNN